MDTTKVQMHEYKAGEVMQLKYFIKKLQGSARREAWSKFNDVMNFASEAAIQELWAHVDVAVELASKPAEVAKKPRVEQNPRKVRKPRQIRPVKKELRYPCTCGKRERYVVKATGKVLPLCPICHKAGKKEQSRVPARLAAPSPDVHAKDLGKAMGEKPVVVAAKIAYKRTVTRFDRALSEMRFQEAKNRFRREGRKPRHTGKTAEKKRAAKAYQRQCEIAE